MTKEDTPDTTAEAIRAEERAALAPLPLSLIADAITRAAFIALDSDSGAAFTRIVSTGDDIFYIDYELPENDGGEEK